MVIDIQDFLSLRKNLPVIDARSEGEYDEGHIPGAVNIPILNNAERVEVGTTYKQKGQAEAIKVGFRRVGPRIIDIVNDAERAAQGKEVLVHCWRGGMRSSNFCQFIGMAGIKSHALQGGYKAYRHAALESFKSKFKLIVIGGCTGGGKTEILRRLRDKGEQVIDLEALANHRGSSFGGLLLPSQPTTEQFQNNLFETILTLDLHKRIWIEDESIAIGNIFLPEPLWRTMNISNAIEIDVPKAQRIQRLVDEYGAADSNEFLTCMERITKKLGGQHFREAKEKLLQRDLHAVMNILLTYYDKAYLTGLKNKSGRLKEKFSWNGDDAASIVDQLINSAH